MNIMVHDQQLYMIDFQDAVAGPISYDVISLLRGRYCRFSQAQFMQFVDSFYRQARHGGVSLAISAMMNFLSNAKPWPLNAA